MPTSGSILGSHVKVEWKGRLTDGVTDSNIQEGLGSIHCSSTSREARCGELGILNISLGRSFGHFQIERGPGADLGHAGEIISLSCPVNTLVSNWESRKKWLGRGVSGH